MFSKKLLYYVGPAVVLVGAYYFYNGRQISPHKDQNKNSTLATNNGITSSEKQKPSIPALTPEEFVPFKLADIRPLNHNTRIFRFDLQSPDHSLILPMTSCLVTKFTPEGETKPVIRPYTPVNHDSESRYLELLIKKYGQGAMSSHIHSMIPGETLLIKGPIKKYNYEPNMHKEIGMIAGGTGITPMLQIIQTVLRNPNDKTKLSLIFANDAEEDILLRKEIDAYASEFGEERFKVYHVLSKPSNDWKGEKGYVGEEIVKQSMPPPSQLNSNDTKIMVCGPPGMVEHVSGAKGPNFTQGEVGGVLKNIGYKAEDVYKF